MSSLWRFNQEANCKTWPNFGDVPGQNLDLCSSFALLHLFYSNHNLISLRLGTLLCYNVEFNCSCSVTLCSALGRGNEVEWIILLMSRHSGKVLVDAHNRFIYCQKFISFWGSSGKFIDHQYSVYFVKHHMTGTLWLGPFKNRTGARGGGTAS